MKKLIHGIVEFRKKVRPDYRETFAKLALGQKPDTLFIACSDSRVVPNLFASADPGDLFVVRNVGNLISPANKEGVSIADVSEAAALEFALGNLKVSDIIVCGHSECGAMQAVSRGVDTVEPTHLRTWLRHGIPALKRLQKGEVLDSSLAPHNQLSQLNVIQQLDHLRGYPLVADALKAERLRLHGWWFDIAKAEVLAYEDDRKRFVTIDETEADRLLQRFFNSHL